MVTQRVWLLDPCKLLGEAGTMIAPWPAPGNVALAMYLILLMNDLVYAQAMVLTVPACQRCLTNSWYIPGVPMVGSRYLTWLPNRNVSTRPAPPCQPWTLSLYWPSLQRDTLYMSLQLTAKRELVSCAVPAEEGLGSPCLTSLGLADAFILHPLL